VQPTAALAATAAVEPPAPTFRASSSSSAASRSRPSPPTSPSSALPRRPPAAEQPPRPRQCHDSTTRTPLFPSLSNPIHGSDQSTRRRQAGHRRHGAGGAATHLRPPPPPPLPEGQARGPSHCRLILGAPAARDLILVGNCRGLFANFHRRTGGLKREVKHQRSIGIGWPRRAACTGALLAPQLLPFIKQRTRLPKELKYTE
jgi:hypothetical protein